MKAPSSNETKLKIGQQLWSAISGHHLAHGKRRESLSYAFARCEKVASGLLILMPEGSPWFAFADDCFLRQSAGQVQLRPDVLNGMLAEFAASDYNCLVNIHDHWFAEDGIFSSIDDQDDALFDQYLRKRFEPMLKRNPKIGTYRPIFNLSLVLGQRTVGARLTHGLDMFQALPVSQIQLIGDNWKDLTMSRHRSPRIPAQPVNQRQASFISDEQQASLASAKIALVGCGGLGSILAETVCRIGARNLVLIDDDKLEVSNLNRWQGATPSDVGADKSKLLAERLKKMFPDGNFEGMVAAVDDDAAVSALISCDVAIGSLDNDAARWFLNHVCLQYLIPYFDAGVSITAGPPVEFKSRFFAVLPGVSGCIECKGELLNKDEVLRVYGHQATQAQRVAAGYITDAPKTPAPSAYMLNQQAASMLTMEFSNFFFKWRPTSTLKAQAWNSNRTSRGDRLSFPETPSAECPICSFRLGAGSLLKLPSRHAMRASPIDSTVSRDNLLEGLSS